MRKGKIYNHLSVFSLGLMKRFICHYSRNFPVTMSSVHLNEHFLSRILRDLIINVKTWLKNQ